MVILMVIVLTGSVWIKEQGRALQTLRQNQEMAKGRKARQVFGEMPEWKTSWKMRLVDRKCLRMSPFYNVAGTCW